MDPVLIKLIGNGSPYAFLLAAVWFVFKPPQWFLDYVKEKNAILAKLVDNTNTIITGQASHELTDTNRGTEHAARLERFYHRVRTIARKLNDKNRHAEMNALEIVSGRVEKAVDEAKTYTCERIDDAVLKVTKELS